jgi:hypothetical protein
MSAVLPGWALPTGHAPSHSSQCEEVFKRVFAPKWENEPGDADTSPSVWWNGNVRVASAFVASILGIVSSRVGSILSSVGVQCGTYKGRFYKMHIPARDFGAPCATCGRAKFRLRYD